MLTLRRVLPLAILLVAIAALWASGLAAQLNWATLGRYQATLDTWIARHPIAAPALYAAIYAAATALSVPEGAVLTVAGGLLFGTALGGTMAVIGASVGAVVLFLAARSAFGGLHGGRGERSHGADPAGISATASATCWRSGWCRLAVLAGQPGRGGLAGMRLLPFAAATLLGIIPATFVFASIGAGVGRRAGGRRRARSRP